MSTLQNLQKRKDEIVRDMSELSKKKEELRVRIEALDFEFRRVVEALYAQERGK